MLVERDAVLRERIGQLHARAIDEVRELLVRIERARRRRRARQAAAEPRTFLVGPVDEVDRQRRRALGLRRAAAPRGRRARRGSRRASRRRAPSRGGCRSRCSSSTRPAASPTGLPAPSRIGVDAELRLELAGEPLARLAPHRPPRDALRAALVGRQGARAPRGQR